MGLYAFLQIKTLKFKLASRVSRSKRGLLKIRGDGLWIYGLRWRLRHVCVVKLGEVQPVKEKTEISAPLRPDKSVNALEKGYGYVMSKRITLYSSVQKNGKACDFIFL